jgi:hypothetical protein
MDSIIDQSDLCVKNNGGRGWELVAADEDDLVGAVFEGLVLSGHGELRVMK